MALRFPLLVKKRGSRRTGIQWLGPFGEGVLYVACILFGAGGLLLLLFNVLGPQWQANAQLPRYEATECTVVGKRIDSQRTLHGFEYRPQVAIRYRVDGDEYGPLWTFDAIGAFTTDHGESEQALRDFKTGRSYRCWYDPLNPERAVVERRSQWWPWLMLFIPVSLLIYGGAGLVGLFWQSMTSTELRSAVAQKAADLELLATPYERNSPLLAVPTLDRFVDSPGVRLRYRLPIDASPNWLLFGMLVICAGWNVLVGVFVYQVIELHLTGRPNWLLTWLMVPFVLAGVWIIWAVVRQIMITTGIGTTRVELSHHPLRPGDTCRAFVSQAGRVNVRWFQVLLVCEERATFQQGTDTREEACRVYRLVAYRARKFHIRPDVPFETQFDLNVPPHAMHSFVSAHNAVGWWVIVRGKVARWPIIERRFPLYVYPTQGGAAGGAATAGRATGWVTS